jgi:hypothetical protein
MRMHGNAALSPVPGLRWGDRADAVRRVAADPRRSGDPAPSDLEAPARVPTPRQPQTVRSRWRRPARAATSQAHRSIAWRARLPRSRPARSRRHRSRRGARSPGSLHRPALARRPQSCCVADQRHSWADDRIQLDSERRIVVGSFGPPTSVRRSRLDCALPRRAAAMRFSRAPSVAATCCRRPNGRAGIDVSGRAGPDGRVDDPPSRPSRRPSREGRRQRPRQRWERSDARRSHRGFRSCVDGRAPGP